MSQVLLSDPLNRHHPLNRGLVGWWLALPGLDGGNKWYDLTGTSHGTLTNMASTSVGWRGTTRPGGWGHLQLAGGSNTHALVPSTTPLGITQDITIMGWMRVDSGSSGMFFSKQTGASWDYSLYLYQNRLQVFGSNGHNVISTGSPPSGWFHGAWTRSGSSCSFYFNGILDSTKTISSNPFFNRNISGYIGSDNADPTVRLTGGLDDIRIYSRALSPTEVRELYDNSRLGYPETLNRVSPSVFVLSSGNVFNEVVAGGSECGGEASPSVVSAFSSSGGSVGGGSASSSTQLTAITLGGVAVAGTASDTTIQSVEFQGGARLSGFAIESTNATPIVLGGAVLGMSASYSVDFGPASSGGLLVAATSVVFASYQVVSTEGALVGGTADVNDSSAVATGGGSVGGGSSFATVDATALTSGGLKVGGGASFVLLFSRRFRIGDPIFFRVPSTDRYLPQRIRGIYYENGGFWYDCLFDELIPERDVLTPDEYQIYLANVGNRLRRLRFRQSILVDAI